MNESIKLLRKLENGERLGLEESRFFVSELMAALQHGRILADDRPLRIYRVVKEINDEQKRINAVWKGVATKRRNRAAIVR